MITDIYSKRVELSWGEVRSIDVNFSGHPTVLAIGSIGHWHMDTPPIVEIELGSIMIIEYCRQKADNTVECKLIAPVSIQKINDAKRVTFLCHSSINTHILGSIAIFYFAPVEQVPTEPQSANQAVQAVYNLKSGEIVHIHQIDFLSNISRPSSYEQKERAILLASKIHKRKKSDLGALSLAPKALKAGVVYKVDSKRKILVIDHTKKASRLIAYDRRSNRAYRGVR